VVQVAAGRTHNLALRSDGTVWAWGRNDHGQLGRGTVSGGELEPARVSVLNRVTKRVTGVPVSIAGISVGGEFAAVLGTDGSVWGWGVNDLGQLNLAPSRPVTRPVNEIAAGSRITQISAGFAHMLALRSDGTVLGWGWNFFGQLGNGLQAQVSGPAQVTNMAGATQVAAGQLASYAVHTVLGLAGQNS
jgi:alpha-tubulin suppressor-like RCC1 family protein